MIVIILEIENLQTPKSSISSKWHPNPKKSDWELYPGCTQFHFYIPLIQTFLWISHSSVFFNLFLLSPTLIPYNYMFWDPDLMIWYKPACSSTGDNADFPKSFLKTLFPWYWGKIWFLTWLYLMRREPYKAKACTWGKVQGLQMDVYNSRLISYNEDLSLLDRKTGCRLELDAERTW